MTEEQKAEPVKSPQQPETAIPVLSLNEPATWPQFMTVEEVAQVIRISYPTVLEHVRTGKIQAQKIGKTYRISRDWLVKNLGYD